MKIKIYISTLGFTNQKRAFKPPFGYVRVRRMVDTFVDECWLFPFNIFASIYYFSQRLIDTYRILKLYTRYHAAKKEKTTIQK